ncbi:MAG: HAMP domain-containing protein, partial [Myxococcota bacterium]
MNRLRHSLSVRLLVRLMGLIAVVLAVHAYFNARAIGEQWTSMIQACANRTSDLIKDATHYGMLLNRKEELHHTIRQIAHSPGVRAIRVYDKQGKIMFSSDEEEIGTQVDTQAEACVICHQEGQLLRAVERSKRLRIFRAPDGESLVGLINPIENEAACAATGCHAPPSEQSVLGVLDVMMSTQALTEAQRTTQQNIVWTTVLLIVLSVVVTTLFVERVVMRPLRRLRKGTQRVAQGDLSTRIRVTSEDELGRLAVDFNAMAEDLQRAHREGTEGAQTLEQKGIAKTNERGHMQRQV